MEVRLDDTAVIDLDRAGLVGDSRPGSSSRGGRQTSRPSWRGVAAIAVAVACLIGVFAAGRASGRPNDRSAAPALLGPTATPQPTATATPVPTPTVVEPDPVVTDLFGEGEVLAELDLGNRARAVLWCRESVPGTTIGSTLTLLHLGDSLAYGTQVIRSEEITRPWVPLVTGRRGIVLETEGLGSGAIPAVVAADLAADLDTALDPDPGSGSVGSVGSQCDTCAPAEIELAGQVMLVGSCVHGVPFGASVVYAIAPPTQPGQTPLALHADCGITRIEADPDGLVVRGEAPLVRGLHDTEFPLPAIRLTRAAGWFEADDLELFDWNCEVARSSQLADRHLLRTDPERRISVLATDSAIGPVGVHGPLVVGLSRDQCSLLTRAWWGRPAAEHNTGSPIAEVLALDPPEGHRDWFYGCQVD